MIKKIIFSSGGTGGHILPALYLMRHFFEKGYEVIVVTDKRGKKFLKNHSDFKLYVLRTETTTNKNFLKKILSLLIIFYSIIESIIILRKEKPDLVFGFGGYVSFPISFVSKFFNLPLIIYENNIIMGRTNKYLSFFAKKIFVAVELKNTLSKNLLNKICKVGPILAKKTFENKYFENKNATKNFSFLILGGSQGAEIFGKIIPPVMKKIKEAGHSIEVNQQCIKEQKDSIKEFYNKNNIKNYLFEFDENIVKLISYANLAITRCGASSTAELTHIRTPFIAVPLPYSIDNHQYLNAKYYEDKGCCWLLEQDNFNVENLFNLVIEAIRNKKKLNDVIQNMKKIYIGNVYNNIENEIKEFI